MSIPLEYAEIDVGGIVYDLSHLKAFSALIPGKGIEKGSDLDVVVVFSNHVFTERTKHGEPHHILDHHGTKRTFDGDRYRMSKTLQAVLRVKIETNELTYVSRSFGGADNLIFIETEDGRTWTIVYCLQPVNGIRVRMEILSAHPKVIDQKKISRKHLSYFARKCLFDGERVPNN